MEVKEAQPGEMTRWIRAPYRFYDDQEAHRPIPEGWLEDLVRAEGAGTFPDVSFFYAESGGEVVGRIAVCSAVEEVADFGFFEAAPGPAQREVAAALIDRARERAGELDANLLRGPVSIYPLFSAGMMSSDFDRTAPIYIDHGRPEYVDLLSELGPTETRLMRSWRWNADVRMPAPARQIAEATRAHPGLRIRPVRTDDFEREDAAVIADLYNDAYHGTWGYRPMEPSTIDWMLRNGDAIDTRCSSIAEIDGEPAAVVVALPNINEVGLTASEHERPWAKVQERIMQAFKTPESIRVFLFGVRQAYRGRAVGGLATLMWHEFAMRAAAAGYVTGETPAIKSGDVHRENALRTIGLRPGRSFTCFTFEVE